MVHAAYAKRLGGAEHLEGYNLNRDLAEIQALLREVDGQPDLRNGGEQRADNAEGQVEDGIQMEDDRRVDNESLVVNNERGEDMGRNKDMRREEDMQKKDDKRMEDDKWREDTKRREEEESVRNQLTPGDIIAMHKDAMCSRAPVFQLLGKKVDDEKLVSLTLSDGAYVSENFVPANETVGRELLGISRYDLIKIKGASVYKDKIILHTIDHLQMTDNRDTCVQIKSTVKAKGVETLKKIRQESLDTWGVRFGNRRAIEAGSQEQDHNSTLMLDDPFVTKAGKRQATTDGELEEAGPSKRSRRQVEQCPFCIRTFVDKETMRVHMRRDHFD